MDRRSPERSEIPVRSQGAAAACGQGRLNIRGCQARFALSGKLQRVLNPSLGALDDALLNALFEILTLSYSIPDLVENRASHRKEILDAIRSRKGEAIY